MVPSQHVGRATDWHNVLQAKLPAALGGWVIQTGCLLGWLTPWL